MTGAIACGQYSVAPLVMVQLHNQEIDAVAFGATAAAIYTINSNGNVVGLPGGTLEAWLVGAGASASSYEVTATHSSGATVTGTFGSWLNCGSSRSWTLANSHQDGSVSAAVIAVQIRDVATSTVQASASITLTAESDA